MANVSVIIPTYNYSRYICEAIDSVLAQTYRDFEIIVVDDGSTDDTRNLLGIYEKQIKYIFQENKGLPAARNTGINVSTGKYLFFLDSDVYILPKKLNLHVDFLETHRELGWTYSNGNYVEESGKIIGKFSDLFKKKRMAPPEGMVFEKLIMFNFIPVNSPVIRRECIRDNFFDESLKSHEDYDFWLRVSTKFEVKYINYVLSVVRIHKSSMQRNYIDMAQSNIAIMNKITNQYPKLAKQNMHCIKFQLAASYSNIGFGFYKNGNLQEAREQLKKSVDIYPLQKRAYLYLVFIWIKLFIRRFTGGSGKR